MPDLNSSRINLLGLSKWKLEEILTMLGEKPYRVDQILKWIHQRDLNDFDLMMVARQIEDQWRCNHSPLFRRDFRQRKSVHPIMF